VDAVVSAAWHEVSQAAKEGGGATDDLVEAIADWLTAHPDAPPGVKRSFGLALTDTWHRDFNPELWMGRDLWVRAFRAVGFVSERGLDLPRRALVVYRGATPSRRLGMAWTTNRMVAVGHVEAMRNRRDGGWRRVSRTRRLWRAVVPPAGILARLDLHPEAEALVDPGCLSKVTEVA
jgi:hypothetical protein